jgi:hypothetical protein
MREEFLNDQIHHLHEDEDDDDPFKYVAVAVLELTAK